MTNTPQTLDDGVIRIKRPCFRCGISRLFKMVVLMNRAHVMLATENTDLYKRTDYCPKCHYGTSELELWLEVNDILEDYHE